MNKKIKDFFKNKKNLRIVIELLGVISVWRGFWGILDMFVFPENELFSYLFSVVLGIGLLLFDNNGLDELE